MEAGNPLLDDYVLGLTGSERPRVCFLPSASGDADHYIVRFYQAFAERCEASHVSLFRRGGSGDMREHLLSQDLIYVGGGSVMSLLGVWRGARPRRGDARGVGGGGGALRRLRRLALLVRRGHHGASTAPPEHYRGLGLLGCSNTVHYDAEQRPRGRLPRRAPEGDAAGYAAGDGAALHFAGERLLRVVSSRPDARAFRMRSVRGRVIKSAAARVLSRARRARGRAAAPARLAALPRPPALAGAAVGGRRAPG